MSNLLAKKALLATLNTGCWRATRLHQSETQKVNTDHNARDIARVTVKLTNHPALVSLGKLHAAARQEHYRLTLPSVDDGFRLLPCGRELEHSQAMKRFETEHQSLATDFIQNAYELERQSAPARLNGLYDPKHWPADISGKFRFTTRYLPCPDSGTWQEWLQESAQEGQRDLQERLASVVRAFADRLKDPKAIFRDTLVSNISEIVELSGDLNLLDDPAIKGLSTQAAELSKVPADILRNDQAKRAEMAKKAADICAMFKL